LFILCIEGLSTLFYRVEQQQLIHGCKVTRGAPLVSHLLITYDNFFLFKAATSGYLCCEIIVAPI
jgi:hypothetical protein